MTLGVLEGHSPDCKPFQMGYFFYIFVHQLSSHGPSAVAELLVGIWHYCAFSNAAQTKRFESADSI